MATPTKDHDSLGRSRRVSQGGAGPKHLPSKDAPKAGEIDTTPPPHLREGGIWFWNRSLSMLLPMGFIDAADHIALTHAAEAFEDYQRHREIISRDGDLIMDPQGKSIVHPLMTTKCKEWKDVWTMLSSFGMTPSSRAKFGGGDEEGDEWTKMNKEAAAARRN